MAFRPVPPPRRSRYREVLAQRGALAIYQLVLAEGFFCTGAFTYLGAVLHHRYHASQRLIGLIVALIGVGAMVGAAVNGAIRSRLGDRAFALASALVVALGFVALVPRIHLAAASFGLFLMGAGFVGLITTLQIRATAISGTARGTAMSLFAFSRFIGVGLGTVALGRLIDMHRERWMLYAAAGGVLMLGTALAVLKTRPQGVE